MHAPRTSSPSTATTVGASLRLSRSPSTDYANALQYSQYFQTTTTISGLGNSFPFAPRSRNDSGANPLSPSAFLSPSMLRSIGSVSHSAGQGSSALNSSLPLPDFGLHGAGSHRPSDSLRSNSLQRYGAPYYPQQLPQELTRRQHRHRGSLWQQQQQQQSPPPPPGRAAMVTFASPTPESLSPTRAPSGGRDGGGSTSDVETSAEPSVFTVGSTTAPDEVPTRSSVSAESATATGPSRWRRHQSGQRVPVLTSSEEEGIRDRPAGQLCPAIPPETICAHCRRRKGTVVGTGDEATSGQGEIPTTTSPTNPTAVAAAACAADPQHCEELFACSCETVWYCGTACQRADWPLHKGTCDRGMSSARSALCGRGGGLGIASACACCGRCSRDLLSCPCGEAFYCDSLCQRRDWCCRHMFFCRLVSRQALLQHILGLDMEQGGALLQQEQPQRRPCVRDAQTQTMPEIISAPGIELHTSALPDAPVGCTTSAELQLSSANDTSGGDSSNRETALGYHTTLHRDGPGRAARQSGTGPTSPTSTTAATERSGGRGARASASMYAYGASYRDAATGSMAHYSGNDMSTSASAGDVYRDPMYSSRPARSHRQDSPGGSGGGIHSSRPQTTATSTGASSSPIGVGGGGGHRHGSSTKRRSSRYNQSIRSLRESEYASYFSPLSRQNSHKAHAAHMVPEDGTDDDNSEASNNIHTANKSNHSIHNDTSGGRARSPEMAHRGNTSSSSGGGFPSPQQLPGLTAFYFATRKVHLEEEACRRAELYRQFILKRVDIAMAALRKEEAERRMAIVTDEVMECLKEIHPAAKVWKERLFSYYYK